MTTEKRPLKVFLCHASADKPKVRELYRTLKRRGVQPWLDAEDLIPGQNWEVEIPKALLSSDAIIICLTPNSVDKEGYVQKEIKFALDKAMEMPEGRIFIIPARLEECSLPFSLRQYHAVDLYEKTGYTKLMQSLKLRASQLERATVQVPKAGETTAEIKKVVEEKEPPEPKEEKLEPKTPKPSQEKVGVGGDVKDSVIVSGSGNVINIGEQKKPEPEKPQPKKTKPSRKPNTAIIVALIGLVGTIIAALLGSPIIERWFSPAPIATELATVTATLTFRPATLSHTIEPSRTPTRFFTSTVTPLPTEITDAKGVSMMLVTGGEFIVGVNPAEECKTSVIEDYDRCQVVYEDMKNPVRKVSLDSYYIDKYEVTNSAYKECVKSGDCSGPVETILASVQYYGNSKYDNYPVVWITQKMAMQYCEWRGARLPSGLEWEKAARGQNGLTYPWGNALDGVPRVNFCDVGACFDGYDRSWLVVDGYILTAPVGSFPLGQSPYMVHDLAGNVSEWVSDIDDDYSGYGNGGIVRGGSWSEVDERLKAFYIYSAYYAAESTVGFRCVRDGNP